MFVLWCEAGLCQYSNDSGLLGLHSFTCESNFRLNVCYSHVGCKSIQYNNLQMCHVWEPAVFLFTLCVNYPPPDASPVSPLSTQGLHFLSLSLLSALAREAYAHCEFMHYSSARWFSLSWLRLWPGLPVMSLTVECAVQRGWWQPGARVSCQAWRLAVPFAVIWKSSIYEPASSSPSCLVIPACTSRGAGLTASIVSPGRHVCEAGLDSFTHSFRPGLPTLALLAWH